MRNVLLVFLMLYSLNSFAHKVNGYLNDANQAVIEFDLIYRSRDIHVPKFSKSMEESLARECALETLSKFNTSGAMTRRIEVSRILLVTCNNAFTKVGYYVQSITINDIRVAK